MIVSTRSSGRTAARPAIQPATGSWIRPALCAGSLLTLLVAPGVNAGEISASSGPLGLGTRINGQEGGSCGSGLCAVAGGTSAGANLFHRFNRFDTRGAITGVTIDNGAHRSVVLGVLDPLGSFLNRSISLSGPAQLIMLSPGGVQLGAGVAFSNVPRLTLSTATSLAIGAGRFEVFGTTAAQAALVDGTPLGGKAALSTDAEALRLHGLSSNGDLVVSDGLITVEHELLLDAQGGSLLQQGGSLQVPGGSLELAGKAVGVAAAAQLDVSGSSGPAPAPVAADGGTIRITAGQQGASVAGRLSAQGRGAAAKGGRIEVTGERVALIGATLDASGPAAGGTVLLGGDGGGANPAVPNATITTVDGSSTVRADALAVGPGGKVVAYGSQRTVVEGLLSVRGGPAGGDGGFVETSGATLALNRAPDLAAPLGMGGRWLIDPFDIEIKDTSGANFTDSAITLKAGFNGANGANPFSKLTAAANGKFYGTASSGGVTDQGAVYEFDPSSGFITLKGSFNGANGAKPHAALTAAGGGLFYGTTSEGGGGDSNQGTVYQFDSNFNSSIGSGDTSITLKGRFDGANGANPYAALTIDNGKIYGTTRYGGQNNQGAVYEFDPNVASVDQSITLKGSFDGANGAIPHAALTPAGTGTTYYGTTYFEGSNGFGGVYEFNPSQPAATAITLKDSFTGGNGANPLAGLIAVGNGIFYGTASQGGANDQGAVYEFNANTASISLKASLADSNGANPVGGLADAGQGLFYGVTSQGGAFGQGAVYEYNANSASISLKASLTGSNGTNPLGGLADAGNGIFYGTASQGGTDGQGSVYAFNSKLSNYYGPTGSPSQLSALAISSALNTGAQVTVDTTNPSGDQQGTISVLAPISKTAGPNASLTLNAQHNIQLNANILSSNNSLDLFLNPDLDGSGEGSTSLASGVRLDLNGGTATFNRGTDLAGTLKNGTIVKINGNTIAVNNANFDGITLGSNLTTSGPLVISSGNLMVPSPWSLNADRLNLSGNGSLQADGPVQITTLDQSGGAIRGASSLEITDLLSRNGGTIAGDFSSIKISQASGSLSPGALAAKGSVVLKALQGELNLTGPISGSTIGGYGAAGMTLGADATLRASSPSDPASSRSIVLAAGSGDFFNQSTAGAAALSVQQGASWAIFADNPSSTPRLNLAGLAYSFKQYGKQYQESTTISGSGNGLFYAYTPPAIVVSLVPGASGAIGKVYDGTTSAILNSSNYSFAASVPGDSVFLNNPSTGSYDNKNAGTGKRVTVDGVALSSAIESGTSIPVYGYAIANSSVSASIGSIAKAPLTIGAVSDSKLFDGTTASSKTPLITAGKVFEFAGDSLRNLSQSYTSNRPQGIGKSTLLVDKNYSLFDGNDGANYDVSFASAPGTIDPLAIDQAAPRATPAPSTPVADPRTPVIVVTPSLPGQMRGDELSLVQQESSFSYGSNSPETSSSTSSSQATNTTNTTNTTSTASTTSAANDVNAAMAATGPIVATTRSSQDSSLSFIGSDAESASSAIKSLGLESGEQGGATTPAQLQRFLQDAAARIRKTRSL